MKVKIINMNSITELAKIIKQGVFPRVLKNEQDIEKLQKALETLDLVDVKQAIRDWNDIIYKRQIIKINGKDGKDAEPEVVAGILKNDPEFLEYLKGEDGCDGEDYVLTDKDKKEIAGLIEVPVVEKVIEKTETIVEQPIVTENIVEVAKYETADEIAKKLDSLKGALSIDVIKGLREVLVQLSNNTGGGNTTQVVNRFVRVLDASGVVRENASEITFGSGLTVTSTSNGVQVTALGSGGSGSGDVVGPASATDNAIARFDATTGKLIQNSSATIDDSGNISALGLALSSMTQGSILFAGASGVLSQDNANFYWDDTNNRLGIGINTPSRTLHVYGNTGGGHVLIERSTTSTTGASGTARFKATSTGQVADGFGPQIAFDMQDADAVSNELAVIAALRNGADNTSILGFYTANAGTPTQKMVLDNLANLYPAANGVGSLGKSGTSWANIYLNTGGVLDFGAGNWQATHSTGVLTVGTGDLRVTNAGTNAASVATLNGTQTFLNKTINASSNTISNLTTSMFATNVIDTDSTLAANSDTRIASQKAVKSYVDNYLTGLQWKTAVLCATTANITLSGEQTIDGVVTSASRVLVKNQSTASQNGIYISSAGAWTRATDADTGAELVGATVFVTAGSSLGDTQWTCTNDAITLGSTSIAFAQVAGAGTYSAGTGLSLTGNQFSIDSTVATLAGSQALTNKTYNGLTISSSTGVLSIANSKTLTFSNTLTFTGTDGSSVAFGAGGTVLYNGGALGTPSSATLTNATGLPLSGVLSSTSTALGVGTLEVGHASDTTISRVSAGKIAVEGVNILTTTSTETVTNKRNQPRVYSAANNASLTPEIDTYDIFHLTAMSANTTINNHSTSTPADGEQMRFRFLDNGTARTLSWGTNYVAKAGVTLPTTTTISKNLIVLFEWNANLSKWNCLASGVEA